MKAIRANDIEMEYRAVQPNRWTFQSDKIREWVEQWMTGRVLNACAGKTHLNHDAEIVRNDINTDREADLHVDVADISEQFEPGSFDCVVFDPPFSSNQSERSYEGQDIANIGEIMGEFHQLLRPGGRVIQMGFTTTCMPGQLGYVRRGVCVFNTLGRQADWLGTVDEKVNEDIRRYSPK